MLHGVHCSLIAANRLVGDAPIVQLVRITTRVNAARVLHMHAGNIAKSDVLLLNYLLRKCKCRA